MKRAILLVCTLALASAADLSKVKSVYLLPMANGLDQYLANHLAAAGSIQVVTDATKADAVLTDRLGESFEAKMTDLYPPPPPPKPPEPKPDPKADPKADVKPASTSDVKFDTSRPPTSSFSRARGNLFLVDAKTRAVIWSDFGLTKDASTIRLDRRAAEAVKRLTGVDAPVKKKRK